MVDMIERLTQKLCMIILLRFGLFIFWIHFWGTLNPVIFIVFGFWDVSMTPQTNIITFGYTKTLQTIQGKSQIISKHVISGKSQVFGNQQVRRFGKICVPKNTAYYFWKSWLRGQSLPENTKWQFCSFTGSISSSKHDVFLEHLEYGISIFQKTWNDIFGDMGSTSPNKTLHYFESLKLWNLEFLNFETKKQRNQ